MQVMAYEAVSRHIRSWSFSRTFEDQFSAWHQMKATPNYQKSKPASRVFTFELEAIFLIAEIAGQVWSFGMNMLRIKKRLERRLAAYSKLERYFVVMMEMFMWNFFFFVFGDVVVLVVRVFLVHFDRLVNFRLVDLLLLDDGRLVMHVHRLHQRVGVLRLLHFHRNVDDDFPVSDTVWKQLFNRLSRRAVSIVTIQSRI